MEYRQSKQFMMVLKSTEDGMGNELESSVIWMSGDNMLCMKVFQYSSQGAVDANQCLDIFGDRTAFHFLDTCSTALHNSRRWRWRYWNCWPVGQVHGSCAVGSTAAVVEPDHRKQRAWEDDNYYTIKDPKKEVPLKRCLFWEDLHVLRAASPLSPPPPHTL